MIHVPVTPKTIVSLLVAIGAVTMSEPARADMVRAVVDREIAEACGGTPGELQSEGRIERDLDGDGLEDLIVSHEWMRCTGGMGMAGRSEFCGMQVCSVNIYVRRGSGFDLAREMLGADVRVGSGARPEITMRAHGGDVFGIRLDPAP
ncbi:hypothetical protein [Salinarimonas chemoclinalis]|uniref:hypothetical protein n=1 Tax=Salinarimonas chemoclinalis TaxID=3241599 RepID=UPI003556A4E6